MLQYVSKVTLGKFNQLWWFVWDKYIKFMKFVKVFKDITIVQLNNSGREINLIPIQYDQKVWRK